MRLRNPALFVLLAAVWGTAFTAIKAGLEFFPPVLFAALRYDIAGVLMLAFAVYVTDRWRPRSRGEWLLAGIGGAFMIAGYHTFLFIGQQGTTSAAAAIVVSLSPILTTAFARVLLPDERLTVLGLVGLLVGFIGVVLMSEPDPANIVNSRTVSIGLIFLAATAFALGSVLTRSVQAELPIETLEAWAMLIGAAIMHLVSFGLGESVVAVDWTFPAIASLGYLVVVASAVGFLIYFDLLERLGPIEINLVSYAVPVAAAITGVVFLGEVPTAFVVGGFVLIILGFVLIKRDAIRHALTSDTPR
ncbi:MAG: DMT family transporter [Halobacteriota archaeon]